MSNTSSSLYGLDCETSAQPVLSLVCDMAGATGLCLVSGSGRHGDCDTGYDLY